MAFPPDSVSQFARCTHTYTLNISTNILSCHHFFSYALRQLKKKKSIKRREKKSLKRPIALIFNLAFTRAYSGCDVSRAARWERWPLVLKEVAGICIKYFWISMLFSSFSLSLSHPRSLALSLCRMWLTPVVCFGAALLCEKSNNLRVPKRIGLLHTLQEKDMVTRLHLFRLKHLIHTLSALK